jgi:hypothetical protein
MQYATQFQYITANPGAYEGVAFGGLTLETILAMNGIG